MGKHVKPTDPGKTKTATRVRVLKNVVLLVAAIVKTVQIISEWLS